MKPSCRSRDEFLKARRKLGMSRKANTDAIVVGERRVQAWKLPRV